MNDTKTLEKRIEELEERVKQLEEASWSKVITDQQSLMDAYYEKAKQAVIREQKASVIFIQRKLYIDFDRAKSLLDRLEKEGIVGPHVTGESRQVLVQ